MTRLRDEDRRIVFAEANDFDVARTAAARLTNATRRLLYVELERKLAEDAISAVPVPTPSVEVPLPLAAPVEQTTSAREPVSNEPPTTSASSAELIELPFAEAKRRAEDAFERDYLSRLMARANGNVTEAARLAGVERSNFRKMLQRNDLRPRKGRTLPIPKPSSRKIVPATTYTATILRILDENTRGLRTCEIAEKIEHENNFAHGILRSLERQKRVQRHGSRYNTLWTLPGGQAVPRIETIPAAAVAVLANATEPMDTQRLRKEMSALLRDVGRPPSASALKRGINRLISDGTLVQHGADERGILLILAPKGDSNLN